MFNLNVCRWRDSNCGPLTLVATTLPTEPLPLPKWSRWFCLVKRNFRMFLTRTATSLSTPCPSCTSNTCASSEPWRPATTRWFILKRGFSWGSFWIQPLEESLSSRFWKLNNNAFSSHWYIFTQIFVGPDWPKSRIDRNDIWRYWPECTLIQIQHKVELPQKGHLFISTKNAHLPPL